MSLRHESYDETTTATTSQDEKENEEREFQPLVRQDYVSEKNRNRKFINIRSIASLVLFLLLSSQLILISDRSEKKGKITRWKVITEEEEQEEKQQVEVRFRPSKKSSVAYYLKPGEIVDCYGEGTKYYLHIISPVTGYAHRKDAETKQPNFKRIKDGGPYRGFHGGWWPAGATFFTRYRFAPTAVVIAQQLWNAMQVVQLYLLICLCCVVRHDQKTFKMFRFVVVVLTIASIILLPLSIYVTSPGGDMLAVVALVTSLLGIEGEYKPLELSMDKYRAFVYSRRRNSDESTLQVDDDDDDDDDSSSNVPSVQLLIREETLAFICNLCSSLYNYNASRSKFPYWNSGFRSIDHYFGLVGGVPGSKMDCSLEWLYTLGFDTQIPLYVPRAGGSTTGSFLLAMLWTVIPFFYVSYFLCMYAMSRHSPAPKVQRMLALFGVFHFLFMTDAVTYKYGRGVWSPHAEVFHWFERFSWRIAILLPIYQNCTSGHWKQGHVKPLFGKILHYFMAGWGTLFFLEQVVLSDVVMFVQFLKGEDKKSVLVSLGLHNLQIFSYHEGLVLSWLVYGVILTAGFCNYGVYLRLKDGSSVGSINKMYRIRAMVTKASFMLVIVAALLCCVCQYMTTHHHQHGNPDHLDEESADE